MHPVFHQFRFSSVLNSVSENFIKANREFQANHSSLYMTLITYIFQIPLDRIRDHYVSYISRLLSQLTFWQTKNKFLSPLIQILKTYTK